MVKHKVMDPRKALHDALTNLDFTSVIKCLGESEVNVDFRDVAHGLQTLLMRLSHVPLDETRRKEIVHLILDRNPNVNIQDSSGRTALMHACIAEKLDIIQTLASVNECEPNIVDDDLNSALTYAVRSRKPAIVETLLLAFKSRGLNVNHRNYKGRTALEEAVAQLDSEISKLLVNIGGADSSVLRQESLSPSPSRRNIAAVLPTGPPKSPRSRRRQDHHQRPDTLPSPSSSNGKHYRPTSPSWASGDMLTVDTPSSRGSSRASSLDDVQEDEQEEEEEKEYIQYHASLKKQRRNSLSLPDLRDAGNYLVSSSPSLSLTSSMKKLHNHDSRFGSQQNFKLPLLVEEEYDSDLDEHLPRRGRENRLSFKYKSQRRNSVSLPDLRDTLDSTFSEMEEDIEENDDDIFEDSSGDSDKTNIASSTLLHRKQQFNKLACKRNYLLDSQNYSVNHDDQSSVSSRGFSHKKLLDINFKP